MNSFHDYHIYGYEVDSLGRELRFKLAWPQKNKNTKITYLHFKGVYGYELYNDSMASITYDFLEVSLTEFISKYGQEIKEAYGKNGAYGPWAHDISKAKNELNSNNVKAIILSSSLGLVGWVLAQKIVEENA